MKKNNNNIKKMADIEYEISNLSSEEQQQLIKTLIWKKIVHEYIEIKTDKFANIKVRGNYLDKEVIEKNRTRLVKEINDSLSSMLDTMLGEDEELKYRIFEKFINSYNGIEQKTKNEICRYNHSFSEWKEEIGMVPHYDEDGEVDRVLKNKKYYLRTCKYCGKPQFAYSEDAKEFIEHETEYCAKRFPQKMEYIKSKVKTKELNN